MENNGNESATHCRLKLFYHTGEIFIDERDLVAPVLKEEKPKLSDFKLIRVKSPMFEINGLFPIYEEEFRPKLVGIIELVEFSFASIGHRFRCSGTLCYEGGSGNQGSDAWI